MRDKLRNYLILWLATLILASLEERYFHSTRSVSFWLATTSLPTLTGGSLSVQSRMAIPLNEVWHYLIISIASGITLAKVLNIIAQSAIAHNWKRTIYWLSGFLGVAFFIFFISHLAYSVGAWRHVGLKFFYNSRGSFGPTILFALIIIMAKFLSVAAQSSQGRKLLFLSLSMLCITSVLVMFAIPIFAPTTLTGSPITFITLVILDGLIFVISALVALFSVVKLVIVAVRRSSTR